MNKKDVSMQTIANKLGCSKVTVFKALNDKQGVSEELKSQIITSCIEMGYSPKKKNKKNSNFIVLTPKSMMMSDEKFFTVILYHINRLFAANGDLMNLHLVDKTEETVLYLQNLHLSQAIHGIFILGEIERALMDSLIALEIPLVAVDFYFDGLDFDYVTTNNFHCAYSATNHLIHSGCKKIGYVGNINETSALIDRYFGYKKALMENRLNASEDFNVILEDSSFIVDLVIPENLPDAFICQSDKIAFLLINKLKNIGKFVPDDISVIAFDSSEFAQETEPSITALNIDKKEIAQKAYQLIQNRISDKTAPVQKIMLMWEIEKRDSTKEILPSQAV